MKIHLPAWAKKAILHLRTAKGLIFIILFLLSKIWRMFLSHRSKSNSNYVSNSLIPVYWYLKFYRGGESDDVGKSRAFAALALASHLSENG